MAGGRPALWGNSTHREKWRLAELKEQQRINKKARSWTGPEYESSLSLL